MGIKRLDVLFVQETHSTKNYENEWKECSGDVTVDKSIGKAQYDRIDRNHSEPHPAPKTWPVRVILGLTLV